MIKMEKKNEYQGEIGSGRMEKSEEEEGEKKIRGIRRGRRRGRSIRKIRGEEGGGRTKKERKRICDMDKVSM